MKWHFTPSLAALGLMLLRGRTKCQEPRAKSQMGAPAMGPLCRAAVFVGMISLFAAHMAPGAEPGAASASSSGWVVRSWQTEDGLPQNTVNALLQTRDGYLWVGTSGGLARFDGVRFHKFGLRDGLRSVRISKLAEDKQGALWIGTTGGGLSRIEGARITSFGAAEGFPAGVDVISMAAGHDGSLWIGTSEGLVKWSGGKFTLIGEAYGLPRKQVRALIEDAAGSLWASVVPGGMFRGRDGKFESMHGPDNAPESIYSLLQDRGGAIWAGSGNGLLWRWRDGEWQRFDSEAGLPAGNFTGLAQDGDGTLWICAGERGMYCSRGERFASAVGGGEFPDESVYSVAVDREGSIWVGTVSDGLHRLSRRVLQYWSATAGLPRTGIVSVAEDTSGVWWIATATKGLYRFDGAAFSKLEDPKLPKQLPFIYGMAASSDGVIWAAGESCLFRFEPGQPTKSFSDPPVGGEAIRALCVDGSTLWLGTYYSTLLKCDGERVELVAPAGSFGGDITSIISESPDNLWIGSSGGVHHWQGGRIVRTWDTRDGLLTASVRALLRDPDGTLWIGTLGGGLARLKDGRIFNITTRQGLTDDVVSGIVADDLGYLNLGTNRGIMRIERRELHALADGKISELHSMAFGKNEGMLKEQCGGGHSPTVIKLRDGRLLFPAAGGIAEINPRQLENVSTAAPHAAIDGVLVDGRARPLDTALVIPPGNHRIDLTYGAPAIDSGEWIHFHYRLFGFEKEWVAADGNAPALYEGLPPGDYLFHVVAIDGRRKWNEPGVQIAFTVRPFFWQTVWFRILLAILIVGLSSGAVWWFARRRHSRQIIELEKTRQHQAELARVSRVSLLGELSASIAHELKQPLAAILSNAQASLRFLRNEPAEIDEVRAGLQDIVTEDQRAAEIISRMRALMKKGEAQMEPRDLNADIEQVLLLIRSDLVARKVRIIPELAEDLPLVRGDHIQLQQVVLNLVVNGCDAMQSMPSEERRLQIATARYRIGMVRISVADRGPGIAPDMVERIFEPFYSTKENGLGMGLAICRAIVEAHGGRLWAENNSDRGATVHFTLNAEEPERKVVKHAEFAEAG